MKILDRAALVIGAAGMWLYMASVEQDRGSRRPVVEVDPLSMF